MTARCFLREFDGTLLAEVEDPSPVGDATWVRRGAGQCQVSMPTDDPAVVNLVHSTPVDGVVFRTAFDSDIELAWWATGLTPGSDPPTWCGPVVSVEHRYGSVKYALEANIQQLVTAFTQEWYLGRSVMGRELTNLLGHATPGADHDLSEWWVAEGSVSSSSAAGDLFVEDRAMLISAAGSAFASFELPPSPAGNTVMASASVRLESTAHLMWSCLGILWLFEDPAGGTDYGPAPTGSWLITVPADVTAGEWHTFGVSARQPPTSGTKWVLQLFGIDTDNALTVGAVRASRPENASARAGDDWSLAAASLLAQQADLLPGDWSYSTTSTGVDLAGAIRWLTQDHEDVVSALGDLDGMGEWWVDDGVLRWAPRRGSLAATMTITGDDLSEWRFEVDASSSATEVVGQMTPDTGDLRVQLLASTGTGGRLVRVEQVPEGIDPQDAVSAWLPALWPTPRKLKRSVRAPSSSRLRSRIDTTLLCMVPPCSGCGWQIRATAGRATPGSGTPASASIAPAGPYRVSAPAAAGKASGLAAASVIG